MLKELSQGACLASFVLAGFSVSGCSGQAESEPTLVPELSEAARQEQAEELQGTEEEGISTLARVESGGSVLSFLQLPGEQEITIEEQSPLRARTTPMRELSGQDLTSLELFRAVAPEASVPEALRVAHRQEADALGRSDYTVRSVSFEPSAQVHEKSFAEDNCRRPFDTPPGANYGPWEQQLVHGPLTGQGGLRGAAAGQFDTFPETVILLGACNAGSRTLRAFLRSETQSGQSQQARVFIRPDSISAYYRRSSVPRTHIIQTEVRSGESVNYSLIKAESHRL